MPAPEAHNSAVTLRPTTLADLPIMFEFGQDSESNLMAGTKPRSRDEFFATWTKHFTNPKIKSMVIELEGKVVGSIACFQPPGEEERDCVGYWVAREHWGKGIASRALEMFLAVEARRPLYATADSRNFRSRRVLEKCGFQCERLRMGEETDRYLSREVAEYVLE
jgi:RimJ/RimL family protein N-acetyltransferase